MTSCGSVRCSPPPSAEDLGAVERRTPEQGDRLTDLPVAILGQAIEGCLHLVA